MARRTDPPTSGHSAPNPKPGPRVGPKVDSDPLDETERRLLEDPELADYLRQKRAEAARIAGEATVERDRKS